MRTLKSLLKGRQFFPDSSLLKVPLPRLEAHSAVIGRSSGYGMHDSAEVFVPHFGDEFSCEVVFHCNQTLFFKGCHLNEITGGNGLGKKLKWSGERAFEGLLSRFGLA